MKPSSAPFDMRFEWQLDQGGLDNAAGLHDRSCDSAMATFDATALLASNIAVRRRGRCVLRDASFEIPDRAIAGILVSDEAAERAIFRVLCGEVQPYEGTVTVGEWMNSPSSSFWCRVLDSLRSMHRSRPVRVDTTADLPRIVLINAASRRFDGYRGRSFTDVVHRLRARGITVVMAAQRLELLTSYCDWLVVIEAGTVTYAGTTPADLNARPSPAVAFASRALSGCL